MSLEILEVPTLDGYARVPIAFQVREILEVEDAGLGGLRLQARPVAEPWLLDHDAEPDNHPARWAERFDLSRWGVLLAQDGGEQVGGAVIAWRTPGVHMLEGREDLAVLWDLRVAPAARGRGVGTALFEAAEGWARARGARWLKVETWNVNVPACRFYARQGCTLGAMHRFASPEQPGEVQLLWYKRLHPA